MPDGKKMQMPMETTTPEGHFARKVGAFILSLPYGWPSLETLHFIGLSLDQFTFTPPVSVKI